MEFKIEGLWFERISRKNLAASHLHLMFNVRQLASTSIAGKQVDFKTLKIILKQEICNVLSLLQYDKVYEPEKSSHNTISNEQ